MKLIIGLGNPGEKYKKNRHNAGHMFVNSFSLSLSGREDIKLLKTDTFMNDSGEFVKERITNYKLPITNLVVVHDDLDIPLGKYKIQFGVGPKVHYGLQSIEEALGTKDFWRVRIGVDNRDPNNRTPGEEYVLDDFSGEELEILDNLFAQIWEEVINKLT